MRLTELPKKIKEIPDLSKDIFIILVIILVSLGGFLLGRISALEEGRHDALRIIDQKASDRGVLGQKEVNIPPAYDKASTDIKGVFVGAKSGKTYYYPYCTGAKRIHEENKVWFSSKEDAEARGYTFSLSCK